MNRVCLDANIWVKVLTNEPGSEQAYSLVEELLRSRTEIIGPTIMRVEVGSILRKKYSRKEFDRETLSGLWRMFNSMPIHYLADDSYFELAWEIAEVNRLVHLYDAVYLACCDGIPFWTADKRLVHSVTVSKAKIMLLPMPY